MPKAQLEVDVDAEEILDDDTPSVEEVVDEALAEYEEENKNKPKKKKVSRKRLLLKKDQQYYFPPTGKSEEEIKAVLKEAKKGLDNLFYTNNAPVEGFRVYKVMKNMEFDDEGPVEGTGEFHGAILARNSDGAARAYTEARGFHFDTAVKLKRGRGRGRIKIEETGLRYGKLLESLIFVDQSAKTGKFKPDAPKTHVQDWQDMYAAGGRLGHYRDENGDWKEPNC